MEVLRERWFCSEQWAESLACFESCLRVPTINDREPESTRRHRVHFRRSIVMEGNLNARDPLPTEKFVHCSRIRLCIMNAVRSVQYDAVTCPALVITKLPTAIGIEIDDGLGPTRTI